MLPSSLQHRDAKHFRYTVSSALWSGPIQKAFTALQSVEIDAVSSEEKFLDHLLENYPAIYEYLERATFHRFNVKQPNWKGLPIPEGGFDFRIAIINLGPDPSVRNELYEVRGEITSKTGWYPLVMGSRALSPPPYIRRRREILAHRRSADYGFLMGDLVSVQNVSVALEPKDTEGRSKPRTGSSILLSGTKGNILLDTAFAVNWAKLDRTRAIFLSHFHQDHSGGFWDALDRFNNFVILSDATLAYLLQNANVSKDKTERLLQNAWIVDSPHDELVTDGFLDTFQVFHAPGSYGLVYRDASGNAVFYPGDMCLRNGFLDTSKDMFARIEGLDALHKTVLLDAAMIRRKDYSIEAEDTPEQILEEFNQGVRRRDVFFIAASEEASVYTFIRAFCATWKPDDAPRIIVNDRLLHLTQRLIQPVLRREESHVDPLVKQLIGRSIVNFIESHRVYPMSALGRFKPSDNLIIFAAKEDLGSNAPAMERLPKSDAIIAGTEALREDTKLQQMLHRCRSILRVASPDWSFHSSESDLASFIRQLSDRGIRSILFHNGSDNIKKWIGENYLDPSLVSPLRHTPTPLH